MFEGYCCKIDHIDIMKIKRTFAFMILMVWFVPVLQGQTVTRAASGTDRIAIQGTPGRIFNQTSSSLQKLDSVITSAYDTGSGDWNNLSKEEYYYDNNKRQYSKISYVWNDVSNAFMKNQKYEYYFDNNGNQILFLHYYLDESTGEWLNNYREDTYFDSYGKDTAMISQTRDPATVIFYYLGKYVKTYNDNGKLLVITGYAWDEDTGKWYLSSKTEYTYDDNGYLILYNQYSWDSSKNEWFNNEKWDYTINAEGKQTSRMQYNWNSSNSQWDLKQSHELTWDVYGNQVSDIAGFLIWTGEWTWSIYKYETTYDLTISSDNLLLTDYYRSISGNKPLQTLSYDQVDGSWVSTYKDDLYYSDFILTGIDEKKTVNTVLYPNPASDFITLRWDGNYPMLDLDIYDINGTGVLSVPVNNNEKIPVGALGPGIYLYRLTYNGILTGRGRFVVR